MPKVTQEQIDALVKLQQIEIESRSIKKKLNTVDQHLEELDHSRLDFKQAIEDQESVISALNQKYRSYEADVRINLDGIKKSEAKLGSVKTNKEYQSLLKEIDDLKAKNSNLEDDMIEFLDRIEEAENALQAKHAAYSELETQLRKERDKIQKQIEEGKRRLEKLDMEWKNVSAAIDAELLDTFNTVKSNQSNALGIVAVTDAVCQGCHMNIPPQLYNELQRGGILTKCPICERIVYWKHDNKRSE